MLRLPIVSGSTVLVLALARPAATAPLQRGDDLALVLAWLLALLVATWLFATSAACAFAVRRGRVAMAHRCVRLLPGFLHRSVQLAIVASTVATSTLPAQAVTDQPVVRGPHVAAVAPSDRPTENTVSPSTTSTTQPRAASRPAPSLEPTTTTAPIALAAPSEHESAEPASRADHSDSVPSHPVADGAAYVVHPGDNLWLIAQRTLEHHARPASELVAYWHAVIETNTPTLRSHDPNLIYPGEVLTLPPLSP